MTTAVLKFVLCCVVTMHSLSDTITQVGDWQAAEEKSKLPRSFRWGPQRPDLLRYNRVEGLSVGIRAQGRPGSPLGPISVTGTSKLPHIFLNSTISSCEIVKANS